MKMIVSAVLLVLTLCLFAACGSETPPSGLQEAAKSQTEQPVGSGPPRQQEEPEQPERPEQRPAAFAASQDILRQPDLEGYVTELTQEGIMLHQTYRETLEEYGQELGLVNLDEASIPVVFTPDAEITVLVANANGSGEIVDEYSIGSESIVPDDSVYLLGSYSSGVFESQKAVVLRRAE